MGLTFTRVHRLLWDSVFLWFKSWVPLSYVVLFPVLTQMKPTPSYYWALTFGVTQMLCQLLPTDLHLKKKYLPVHRWDSQQRMTNCFKKTSIWSSLCYTGDPRNPHMWKTFPLICYATWKSVGADSKRMLVLNESVCLRNAPYYLNSDCTCIWISHLISGTKSHGTTY